jgi:nucleoside-diphosphate-sugar epimerase
VSRALVTGVAGFIGSTLADALLRAGWDVIGIDAFTDHYAPRRKRDNLVDALENAQFRLEEVDLRTAPIERYLQGVTHVVHLAALPGVRASWGDSFREYAEHNILATQRLLEAMRGSAVERAVMASSSSIYGTPTRFPTAEEEPPRPLSPYGVTKLSAEALLHAYRQRDRLTVVALRYFTVYGPRQRPDMGFHAFFEAARNDAPVTVYGDGGQTRDFTYVDDAVAATVTAMTRPTRELTYNVGGGHRVSLNEVLSRIERVTGRPLKRRHVAPSPGDPRDTSADITRARRDLAYDPKTELTEGLERQWAWQRNR